MSGTSRDGGKSMVSEMVDVNVGGVHYTTKLETLTLRYPGSFLARLSAAATTCDETVTRDSQGRLFIDRDGLLFRFVLDFVRTGTLILPDDFVELRRLLVEARYFELDDMVAQLGVILTPSHEQQQPDQQVNGCAGGGGLAGTFQRRAAIRGGPGYITVGYRGTFSCSGRGDGLSDVRFRKVSRILVSGRATLCRLVFGDTLNESRNPEHSQYSARFYLKHAFIEQAFDALLYAGFRLVAACGTGTNSGMHATVSSGPRAPTMRTVAELKPPLMVTNSIDNEESRWNHYNEFIFCRM